MSNSTKLVNVLLFKSLVETILVGAIAVLFFIDAFPPSFRGWGEVTSDSIAGWVVNSAEPWQRVEVQLFVDDAFVDRAVADRSRPDVAKSGWALDEWHGFQFELPPLSDGQHEARVYALHSSGGGARRSLQLIGDPILFRRNPNGTLKSIDQGQRAD